MLLLLRQLPESGDMFATVELGLGELLLDLGQLSTEAIDFGFDFLHLLSQRRLLLAQGGPVLPRGPSGGAIGRWRAAIAAA